MGTPEDKLTEYAIRHTSPEDPVLVALSRETHLRTVYPNMLSGHLQGKLLEMISRMVHPKRILEIGTFTGYSAICLVRGLAPEGILHTIDKSDETLVIARKYFDMAGVSNRIRMHIGDAREIIPTLEDSFDMVFIDGDKEEYLQYYNAVFDKVTPGGMILADNVLWGGKVVNPEKFNEKETRGILEFNTFVAVDNRIEKLLLPIRDGLYMLYKR
jgi:predicted O-methyltransferase YrrM